MTETLERKEDIAKYMIKGVKIRTSSYDNSYVTCQQIFHNAHLIECHNILTEEFKRNNPGRRYITSIKIVPLIEGKVGGLYASPKFQYMVDGQMKACELEPVIDLETSHIPTKSEVKNNRKRKTKTMVKESIGHKKKVIDSKEKVKVKEFFKTIQLDVPIMEGFVSNNPFDALEQEISTIPEFLSDKTIRYSQRIDNIKNKSYRFDDIIKEHISFLEKISEKSIKVNMESTSETQKTVQTTFKLYENMSQHNNKLVSLFEYFHNSINNYPKSVTSLLDKLIKQVKTNLDLLKRCNVLEMMEIINDLSVVT